MPLPPSLKALAPECKAWLDRARASGDIDRYTQTVEEHLKATGPLSPKVGTQMGRISHFWSVAACDAYFREDLAELAQFFCWTIESRALLLRLDAVHSQMHSELGNWPQEYSDSLRAAGPTVLSDWATGKVCAQRFLEMAEKDEQLNTLPQSRRIAHNTHDVFLIGLLSAGYGLATHFEPRKPLIAPYQAVLDTWKSQDQNASAHAMSKAADFHLSRSKASTGSKIYEFDRDFDRVFPIELLAVLALRRRHGLPDFPSGHALIDGPWSMIKDLSCPPPSPLLASVLARVEQDYPLFR
ncbi:hypothetical protein XAP3CFBP6996_009045 [Xanthomonas citri pv. fuscans CFBP 6996]|uniref:hypothetical protein n=1 Tax=Xanthomonas citri TaxID=346 RepID=UPI000C17ADD8|nr:hypothetical protein [Xanthomonas citri]PTY32036.1 hypothetical protein XAP3CFBP6996_009045 [Xanthomonas citri pv. fuscans CFBP 6996]QTF19457.1 hypothetical protein XcfCFBP6992P_11115 [Xanthomonas citri pv. phaseoli var. fuscans]QTF76527.1 hypothetical protein XcfCFBP6994P_19835 [Xanthomonas citri pv. phaseoli var. fuscans]QTF76742.1 hypothetical protein XcfCFBP6996P_05930 [Xanthomonas citri pv. phaseoli var. fuscans]QWN15988.1 hypothetical protein DGN02_09140 [Xanthomonas citri]